MRRPCTEEAGRKGALLARNSGMSYVAGPMRFTTLVLLLALPGCASSDPSAPSVASDTSDALTAKAQAVPTVSFAADWSSHADGPITSGGKVRVHYDLARLPSCRAQYMGFPAWDILAHWSVDGGPASSIPVTVLNGTVRSAVEPIVDVPAGKTLQFWFSASDEYGCTQWDSNYGKNFSFPLAAPTTPTLSFRSDWSVTQLGTPKAGGTLEIDYDVARLPTCRSTYGANPAWSVSVDYRFDGGPVQSAPLTQLNGSSAPKVVPALLAVPATAHSVELWFENGDVSGCHAYDSAYGQNYRFSVAP